ncbi:hypothetical protein POSPLADRAFT_1039759, partial [Postia placenta MAD-698-R-SB12]
MTHAYGATDVGPGSHMHSKKHAKWSMLGSLHLRTLSKSEKSEQSCSAGNKFNLQAEMGLE